MRETDSSIPVVMIKDDPVSRNIGAAVVHRADFHTDLMQVGLHIAKLGAAREGTLCQHRILL